MMSPTTINTQQKGFFSLLLFCASTIIASGDYGDYADLTFQCPALTTCPVVCVTDAANCPASMTCQNGTNLCADGSCSDAGCSSDLENPCIDPLPPIACKKVVDYYSTCRDKYQEAYDYQTQYSEDVTQATTTLITFKEPIFIFCYSWISAITALIVLWCAYNQRFSPVPGSSKPLQEATGSTEVHSTQGWTQIGYHSDFVGISIYVLTCVTVASFHVLLAILTVFYYAEVGTITWCPVVIADEEQLLLCFIIVWMVGFLWSFTLKWPPSLYSLFLRRCSFQNATFVAVIAPTSSSSKTVIKSSTKSCMANVYSLVGAINFFGNSIMKFIFSDVADVPEGWQMVYCRVRTTENTRYFYYKLRRYTYDAEVGAFVPSEWFVGSTLGEIVAARKGLSEDDVQERLLALGPNSIFVKRPKIFKSLYRQFSGKFYTYQFYIIWSWTPLDYYYMAILYFFIVIVGGITVAAFEYENETSLYKLSQITGTVEVLRDGKFQCLDQSNLVPGDVVVLQPGITYCDMVLLQGSRLVVDESALTGESTPVSKTAIDAQDDTKTTYNTKTHKRQTILAGTTIVECFNDNYLGLVMKTGSYTSRGELLRDILTFERHKFKFDVEVQLVVAILVVYGIMAFIITGFVLIKDSWIYGWFYGIYVLAAVISALLPTVFVVSVGVSEKRLIKRNIACVRPENILVAGKVNVAFFDKTGTLTKQGLEFLSARSHEGCNSVKNIMAGELLSTGMACCHTLVATNGGILVGNNLDKIMFEATGAKMKSPDFGQGKFCIFKDDEVFTILKRFDFDHERMTQSVIVQNQKGNIFAFVKGSAESIKSVCIRDSLPQDFDTSVKKDAKEGIYQISMAMKEIESDQISRSRLESSLTFIGFISFKNMLREETSEVLRQLDDSKICSTMVTGDSILTGIRVARECNLIKCEKVLVAMNIDEEGGVIWVDESDNVISPPSLENKKPRGLDYNLAMTGSVWEHILNKDHSYALELLDHVRVFGRCTPGDKVSLISAMNQKGYITSMCGDGGNDCGALKAAHVGIALSDAEASMVASFTSIDKTITSVVEVLKEGRCALASAFASYKYMILYGQVEAMNQMVTAYFQVTFSQWNWVFMDGFWVVSMAFSLPLAKAAKKLSPERPTASLLGPHTMFSACGVLALNFAFMIISLSALFHQDWYHCRKWDSTDVSDVNNIGDNYEAQTLFIVTGYQYINSAMAFNFGYTFRSAWIKNYVFVILALGWTIIQFYITLVPGKLSCFFRVNCSNENVVRGVTSGPIPIKNYFNTTIMPMSFRWILVSIMVSNTIAIMGYEYFIVNGLGKRIWRGKKESLTL
jgi:predicted P-type ATPase